jgi:hypothetical protein
MFFRMKLLTLCLAGSLLLASCAAPADEIAMDVQADEPVVEATAPAAPWTQAPVEETVPLATTAPGEEVLQVLADARDTAVAYIVNTYGLPAAGSWTETPLDPPAPGTISVLYMSGPWNVNVTAEASAPGPNQFQVVADHMSAIVRWEGIVNADGSVSELSFTEGQTDAQTSDTFTVTDWVGRVVSLPQGGQFDDYFERLDKEGSRYGIDAQSADIRQVLDQVRDTDLYVRISGTLYLNVPDSYNSQIQVTSIEFYTPQ